MGVKIEKNVKIGSNNAIGENAKVTVTNDKHDNNQGDDKQGYKQDGETMWFARHPWLSAFIVSGIVAFVSLFSFVKNAVDFLEGIFN